MVSLLPRLPWNINSPQFSKAHITSLNLSNFNMIEAMELKIIASWSPCMALLHLDEPLVLLGVEVHGIHYLYQIS
jgi:hypothetical protein